MTNQITEIIAENEMLCQAQEQAIINSPITDFLIVDSFIVNSPVSYAGNKQHKSRLRPSAIILVTAKQRYFKLQNPLVYEKKCRSINETLVG